MERKEERVMARQSIFKFNERVTTEAKDATYEFRGPVISVRNLEKKFGEHEVLKVLICLRAMWSVSSDLPDQENLPY